MNILILDPCEDVRNLLSGFLEFHGHKILAVDDPTTSYSICKTSNVDILISEYFPNNDDYYKLFLLLKEKNLISKTIVLTSASYVLTELDDLLDAGINCLFHKPVDPKIILDTICDFEKSINHFISSEV